MFSLRLLTSFSPALPSPLSESSSSRCYRPPHAVASVSLKADSVVDREEFRRDIANLMQDDGEVMKRRGDFAATDDENGGGGEEEEEGEEEGISRIQVPRQKYIHVSKSDIVNGIVSTLFDSGDVDADIFLLISSCLDSFLHAEYKGELEQMRGDYYSTQSMENNEDHEKASKSERESNIKVALDGENLQLPTEDGLDYWFWSLLTSSTKNGKTRPEKSVTVASRFQRSFMRLLRDAGFEELSARDLALTSALNTDYLLTLPIYVDWKKASKSNAIIFRRGYATERQKGLLIVEKLDYIQSVLLRGIFSTISKPLAIVGKWISKVLREASQTEEVQEWIKRKRVWLKELSLFQQSYFERKTSDDLLKVEELSPSALPIWLAAQKAVSRYEGLLSPVGPREKLFRKLLGWIGIMPPRSDTTFQLKDDSEASEPYLRPIFLSRMTLSDIWRPATKKVCGNDIWKRIKTSISIFLSPSTLQEPAFQELILLYTKDVGEKDERNEGEAQSLQLKIYEKIPLPDLPVVFPHKKLYFRIIDTVRLDVATIVGLLAYFINYKFENISSSPSALLLDVIAISALIIYASRVVLGYKQTWDRYQLLVNKTLYEKTLASGFGSVHFLLDASEQQQYKEAILTYAVLLKSGKNQFIHHQEVRDKCERFMYNQFKAKVEVRIDEAINTLTRLGLVKETSSVDGNVGLQAVPCAEAYAALKERWNTLLGR